MGREAMSGVWELFRSDLRRATRSVMALIVLCGLVVIPSVFTWFNVIGSWTPFENTKNLKVAVASIDEGYTSPLFPLHINVGDRVEAALRANDQLDWVITTRDDAIAGTESGEYYAAMVMPEDFSERMLTFYTAGAERTHIDYYTNDKSNPLAPLITEEGADELSAKINAEFTRELSDIALSLVSSLADSLGDADSEASLVRIHAHIEDVAVQLRATAGTATMFTALLEGAESLVTGAADLLGSVASEFSTASGMVQEGLTATEQGEQALDRAVDALAAALESSRAQLDAFAADVDEVFSGLDADTTASIDVLDRMVDDLDDLIRDQQALRDRLADDVAPGLPDEDQEALAAIIQDLDDAIGQEQQLQSRLAETSADLATGNQDVHAFRTRIEQRIADAEQAFSDAGAVYENELRPTFERFADTLGAIGSSLSSVSGQVTGLSENVDATVPLLQGAADDNRSLALSLQTAADDVDEVAQALQTAIDTGDFSQIGQLIGADPSVLATAISQPIGVERIPVYPVVSFGAGMSPLYTILSLWVGALLLSVTLRVEAPARATDDGPELTLNQQFFGRYLIFALVGLAQSTLVGLGNILLVGLAPVHPMLLMVTGWVASLVFTFIIYTLIVSFEDVGKALAVFLLVIQVAGAGGAYPLVLLPEWFQNASPFLPATHAIDAFRAALAGIYEADYWISLGWLLAFVAPMLLLGLVLRKPLIGVNKTMDRMLQSTKLL